MKKLFFLWAVAMVLGSCSDQNFNGDSATNKANLIISDPSNKTVIASDGPCPGGCAYPMYCSGGVCYSPPPFSCGTAGCKSGGYSSSGNYSTINSYYQYPRITVDFSCLPTGDHINITVSVIDVPNRFTIYDGNGNLVLTSGWIGYANYPGEWGSSLSTSYNVITLPWAKATNTYQLLVETQTPPNYNYSPTEDYWSATWSCQNY
jgi:hypothetical protein